jgi:VWFA-related protein
MRLCSGIFIVVALALPIQAQPFTEKIDVSIVNVDVTVTSRGEPVRELTRDDFEVFEDGRPQTITNFYAVEGRRSPASAGAATAPPDERYRRKVLVIVDNLTTTRYNRDRALDRLEHFINDRFTGGEYEWSLVLVDRRAQMMLPATSDKSRISEALGEIRKLVAGDLARQSVRTVGAQAAPLPSLSSDGSVVTVDPSCDSQRLSGMLGGGDRMMIAVNERNSIAALTQAVRGFSRIEGRKIILLLTSDLLLRGGFDPLSVNSCMPAGTQVDLASFAHQRSSLRDYLTRESNASGVSLYIINTEGLRAPDYTREDQVGASAMGDVFVPPTDNSSLYWLARETGGRLFPGNDVAKSLASFDVVSSNFYSLGYRPDHPEDAKYHRITVRLTNRRRYELRYRDGYASFSSDAQLARALLSPVASFVQASTIPVTASAGQTYVQNGGVVVPIEARVAFRDLQFLPAGDHSRATVDLYVSIFDEAGKNVAFKRFTTFADAPSGVVSEGELIHTANVRLNQAKPHTIVIAVRDQTTDAAGLWRHVARF